MQNIELASATGFPVLDNEFSSSDCCYSLRQFCFKNSVLDVTVSLRAGGLHVKLDEVFAALFNKTQILTSSFQLHLDLVTLTIAPPATFIQNEKMCRIHLGFVFRCLLTLFTSILPNIKSATGFPVLDVRILLPACGGTSCQGFRGIFEIISDRKRGGRCSVRHCVDVQRLLWI